eukprot:591659_1
MSVPILVLSLTLSLTLAIPIVVFLFLILDIFTIADIGIIVDLSLSFCFLLLLLLLLMTLLAFVVISVFFMTTSSGYHVLVTSTVSTFSHWSQILHISKGLLSRDSETDGQSNFITFAIAESRAKYLNTIRDEPFKASSYQILYTPIEPEFDVKLIQSLGMVRILIYLQSAAYTQSMKSVESLATFLNHTQSIGSQDTSSLASINRDLQIKQNDIATLVFTKKVDVCLVDSFHFFAISLCNLFDIPTLIRIPPFMNQFLEYSTISNTHLFFYMPFIFDFYLDTINGTVVPYTQRWKTFMQNIFFKLFQRFISYYTLHPLLHQLNDKLTTLDIDVSFDLSKYTNGWFSFWERTAIISSLGPPFSDVLYHRPRIKQFGFILYPSAPGKLRHSELWSWINSEDTGIVVISMGSKVRLTQNAMHSIYTQLMAHSKLHNYRVLWALRQTVYEHSNQTNDALETEHFRIKHWIAQSDILQHKNVKLFFSHGGSGGTIEGLYSKTLMVLYPFMVDQVMNAHKLVELECGLMIEDKDNLSDLTKHIDTLLVNKTTSAYYQNKMNHMHEWISKNGGVDETVDFVEYAAHYGVKHLLCSYGANYDCTQTVIPWYQQCVWDIYVILSLILFLFVIGVKRFCHCVCGLLKRNRTKSKKD